VSAQVQPGTPRILLVISAEPAPQTTDEIAAGRQPRKDYLALRDATEADLLSPSMATATWTGRALRRLGGKPAALAWAAFQRRGRYDIIFSDNEGTGLPLALLLRGGARPGQPRHVCLSHYLSSAKKRVWFRLGAGRRIDMLIAHSSAQLRLAVETLGMPAKKVALLPYFADERFWDPALATPDRTGARPMICSAGLEFRDYTTLIAAVRDLEVDVRIGAASHWAKHNAFGATADLPESVTVSGYNYQQLRDLYASARFVVVPLRDVDNQAGITTILEAMAMGKAVVVTRTRGQTDVVRDWRAGATAPPPGFLAAPEVAETLGALPTGWYVRPNDAGDLSDAINYLLAHPEIAEEMGRNARRVAEGYFGLDAFIQRFGALLRG
jgi:glycosyltransferase involved in cell wall biosynthesis